jgi:hypothetical protein
VSFLPTIKLSRNLGFISLKHPTFAHSVDYIFITLTCFKKISCFDPIHQLTLFFINYSHMKFYVNTPAEHNCLILKEKSSDKESESVAIK